MDELKLLVRSRPGWNVLRVSEDDLAMALDRLQSSSVDMAKVKVSPTQDGRMYLLIFPWGV